LVIDKKETVVFMTAQFFVLIIPKSPLKIQRGTWTRNSGNGPHFGSTSLHGME